MTRPDLSPEAIAKIKAGCGSGYRRTTIVPPSTSGRLSTSPTEAEWHCDLPSAATIRAMCEEIERLRDQVEQMGIALGCAGEWFQAYAAGHSNKGDTDKARRNQDRAEFCRARAALGDKT